MHKLTLCAKIFEAFPID